MKSHAHTPSPRRELAQDREAGGVGGALEEQRVRVDESLHVQIGILTLLDMPWQDPRIDISRYRTSRRPAPPMYASPELVALIQREREHDIEHDRLGRLAACARAAAPRRSPTASPGVLRARHLSTVRC